MTNNDEWPEEPGIERTPDDSDTEGADPEADPEAANQEETPEERDRRWEERRKLRREEIQKRKARGEWDVSRFIWEEGDLRIVPPTRRGPCDPRKYRKDLREED